MNRKLLCQGMKDGIPIALGYLAVSFTLGIMARNAGLTASQGFLASFLLNASAGEYAGFTVIAAAGSYLEAGIMILVANARYFLMSCALSQKLAPDTPLHHRLLIGYDLTDELFGISIARSGWLNPYYFYGAMLLALPSWATGTALGVLAGNILPLRVVSALGVALYGMFFAVIIPPARRNHVVAGLVLVSFVISFLAARLPVISQMSDGTRIILLTVVIAAVAAVLFPLPEQNESEQEEEHEG